MGFGVEETRGSVNVTVSGSHDPVAQLDRSGFIVLQNTLLQIVQSDIDAVDKVESALKLLAEAAHCDLTVLCDVPHEGNRDVRVLTSCGQANASDWIDLVEEAQNALAASNPMPAHAANGFDHMSTHMVIDPTNERPGKLLAFCYEEHQAADNKTSNAHTQLVDLSRYAFQMVETEKAQVAEYERFQMLSKSIPGVVYQRVVRPDGKIFYTYISETAKDIFGISADEILRNPRALFNSYAPEYRDQFRERLLQASKDMVKWDVEASIIQPDGSVRYTHAIANPSKQADGSILWTGVILDATRIKEAEQRAEQAAQTTRRNIIENLGQGFVMFDSQNKLMLVNSTFRGAFGGDKDALCEGMDYEAFIIAEMAWAYPVLKGSKRLDSMRRERQTLHNCFEPYHAEFNFEGDQWRQVNEHRTEEGETILIYTDVSEIKTREARIQHMAMHDALTGLPNRMLFKDRCELALKDMKRFNMPMALLSLDLDNFKTVNDTMGHPAGDRLLQIVSQRITDNLRETDTLARLGGDEFAIVMRDIGSTDEIDTVCQRIIECVSEPMEIQGCEANVGVSIGVAFCRDCNLTYEEVLKNSDLALYKAKEDGKNTHRYFQREMDETARARRFMEVELRKALNDSALKLHFQPQVDVDTGEIKGFEALSRWNHPELGKVAPDEFIKIAEEAGMIGQLGEWVLFHACQCAATWSKPLKVAVNVSPAQLRHADFFDSVTRALFQSGLAPDRLELEITESILLYNTAETLDILYRLKGLGLRIAMDDFGTGYSSLGNLRSFPFDRIKIDKSFIMNLETDREAIAIVKAVVGLGKSLGIQTTAEGVETETQLATLMGEGCSDIQGFYFSKALPHDAVEKLLNGETTLQDA